MSFTLQDLKVVIEGVIEGAQQQEHVDTSEWLVEANTYIEFPMSKEQIIAEGKKLGATAAYLMWDHRYREEKVTYHEPQDVVFFMGPLSSLWWGQERLEHSGVVLGTVEISA